MGKKTKQDPTGQATNRRTATRKLQNRFTLAERGVKALFRAVPRTRRTQAPLVNAKVVPVYDYQISPAEMQVLEGRIRNTLDNVVLETTTDRMPPNWWWQNTIETPYRQGTVEEIVEFNKLVTDELVRTRTARGLATQRLEVGFVLQSQGYNDALNNVYVRNFGNIKGLSDRTAEQVIQQINAGIAAHKTPSEIAATISERFDVSRSSAQRTANTEVNQAYNDARLDATEVAAKQTGLRAGVLHLSALIPTTRDGHAARHGNAYTVEQERRWWNTSPNRINCHCSTRSVLIDAKGKVIDLELQEELKAEREFFDEPPEPVAPKKKRKRKAAPKLTPLTEAEKFMQGSITDPKYKRIVKAAGVPDIIPPERGGAYFSPFSKGIHMGKLVPGTNKGDATFRHEYGHYVDDANGTVTLTQDYDKAVLATEKAILAKDKAYFDANKAAAGIQKGTRYSKRAVSQVWQVDTQAVVREWVGSGDDPLTWGKANTKAGGIARMVLDKLGETKTSPDRMGPVTASLVAAERSGRSLGYISALWDEGGSSMLRNTWREGGHVTDLVGAITNNKHGGGHSNAYYKGFKRGKIRFGNNLEAFAQTFSLNATDAGPLGRLMVDEFAPELVKALEELL